MKDAFVLDFATQNKFVTKMHGKIVIYANFYIPTPLVL